MHVRHKNDKTCHGRLFTTLTFEVANSFLFKNLKDGDDMLKIYIDGQAGTTGLALEERLEVLKKTAAIEILKIADDLRKDEAERKRLLNDADVVFLCLPDEAAIESVAMISNPKTVVIDASTAHRTHGDWVYGFPELSPTLHEAVAKAKRISVPGCHATGFIALIDPLIKSGLIKKTDHLTCYSLTGYSGGGKQMIADYETSEKTSAAWMYALDLNHKHLPEMKHLTGLVHDPLFVPTVVPIHKGMIVSVPLMINAKRLHETLANHYKGSQTVKVLDFGQAADLHIENNVASDEMEIYVFGHEKQAVVAARFDNLGKGSSGAAVACMKVRFGL